ncbi:MAG: tryptophan-rich sensory protein [Flavobacteriaceae bacterium]|nr:tryptophan-rich sensory protein [Flavobacteriaceae bacterium]MDG2349412.1 tryptophan-rich sensory protein [Flavobacteriaceae bacterium]
MKHFGYVALFLITNFAGLYFGSMLMNEGPSSAWYLLLNQAPWTPPGWVFGIAWITIMLCFSFYLASLIRIIDSVNFWAIYTVQCILNISWNYVFFNLQKTVAGLIIISLLTVVMVFYFYKFKNQQLKYTKYLLSPYILWLFIASSLNLYIVIYN